MCVSRGLRCCTGGGYRDPRCGFTCEELSAAKFLEDMGVASREEGFEIYAGRYNDDFTDWSIGSYDAIAGKEDILPLIKKWHEASNTIIETSAEPLNAYIDDDLLLRAWSTQKPPDWPMAWKRQTYFAAPSRSRKCVMHRVFTVQ